MSSGLTREQILHYCANPPVSSRLCNGEFGNKVLKINSDLVIKYGAGVRKGEAITQDQVFRMFDPKIIRVPRVHDYFEDSQGIGYIIMDYVHGEAIDMENISHVDAVRRAYLYLSSFERDHPGPVHSGEPSGVLFEDEVPRDYSSLKGLESWINCRQNIYVCLQGEQCVLCHLDLTENNMLLLGAGTVCLLDWYSAGFYPRYFELASQQRKGRLDPAIVDILEAEARSFTDDEIKHKNCLIKACNNAQRFSKPRPRSELVPDHSMRYIAGPPLPTTI